MKITVSVIKADVGGIGGHTLPSDGLLNAIRNTVKNSGKLLIDHYIGYCGDDSHIVMTHTNGVNSNCLLYTSPSPRDRQKSRMPSSA